ncbi:MAG: hypothetical protein FI681_06000 [SAR202 cluster bacterium]|nr:hypothetical protein [SAR202 cluster bacterium]
MAKAIWSTTGGDAATGGAKPIGSDKAKGMAKAMGKDDIKTLASNQIIGLATGIDPKQISDLGSDKLVTMVDKIDVKDVKSLGSDSLSSMMSGVQGTQIADLKDDKKVSIVDNLGANFFGASKATFADIDKVTDSTTRPTITPPTVSTKIVASTGANGVFSKSGLFKTKK